VTAALGRLLRSAGFARLVIVFLTVYTAIAAWLPWARAGRAGAPGWAVATGLDHPFSAAPFLAGCAALFASTLACTWGRRSRTLRLFKGELPPGAVRLPALPGRAIEPFLRARGFAGEGRLLVRHRWALWGGWILHVGLLVLIAGVIVQQAVHDGGAFQLAEGEESRLDDPGALSSRHQGPLAPSAPPDVGVALERFEPLAKQPGYAADRVSTLLVQEGREAPRRVTIDRAAGVEVGGTTIYQAIPTGLVLQLDMGDGIVRSLHMPSMRTSTRAEATFLDARGRPLRFAIETERPILDPAGAGAVRVSVLEDGRFVPVEPGAAFPFGPARARLAGVVRWGAFTYVRSPGMPLVLLGFVLVLGGATLLSFPAGLAQVAAGEGEGDAVAAVVFVTRGGSALARAWATDAQEAAS
jgi:hypothetical protein